MAKPQKKPSGVLIANRSDRLGARLIAILNTMRLAHSHSFDYRIHWLEKWDLTDPEELFKPEFIEDHFLPKADFVKRRKNATPFNRLSEHQPSAEALVSLLRRGTDVILDTVFGVFQFPEEDEAQVRTDFLSMMGKIAFNDTVADWMRHLEKTLRDTDVESVAYHIRRGDLTEDIQALNRSWPNKFVPDEFFERHIATRLENAATTILFSDSEKVIETYKAKFPSLLLIRDLIDFEGLTQAQIDMLELYAMSCCNKIVAPPESAFSQTAQTIGNAAFVSVESDLTEKERVEGYENLCHNLEHNPEVYDNKGEIGQYLVYADQYLTSVGRTKDLTRIMVAHVEDGLCISFVFALLFKRLFQSEQYEEILRVRKFVDEGYVYNLRSFAQVALYHGCALLALGRKDEGLKQIASAFWHEPVEGEINVLCAVLLSQGDFNPGNFWFTDDVIARYMHNSWAFRYLQEHYPQLLSDGTLRPPKNIATCRTLVWEWGEFTRAHTNAHYRYVGHFKSLINLFNTRMFHPFEQPHADSFHALAQLRQGNVDQADDLARKALAAQPDNALFHKRVADVHLAREEYEAAAEHLTRAVRLSPDVPMYSAHLGYSFLQAGKPKHAIKAFDHALESGKLHCPQVYFFAAEAHEALGDGERELDMLSEGLALSPMHWRRQVRRADLLREQGRSQEARHVLSSVHRWADRRPPVTLKFAKLLDKLGEKDEAVGVLSAAAKKYPDKAQFMSNLKKLQA